MAPTVSVIIPCFNASLWIRQALDSAISQNYEHLEIIVIDDGSTDDSFGIVRREYRAVRAMRTPRGGPSRARNIGTMMASGQLLQYLDADDVLADGKIRAQVAVLEESGADVAYGAWQKLRAVGRGYSPAEVIANVMEDDVELTLFRGFWCPPAAYLFRRVIVEKVGGWNERLPLIQDARFTLDCALNGGRFAFCHGIMASYRVHDSGSVSTGPRLDFLRDCLVNAEEVCAWWRIRGLLDNKRRYAVAEVCDMVARGSLSTDRDLFERACHFMAEVCPAYKPVGRLRWAVRYVGYRRAALVVGHLRQAATAVRAPACHPNSAIPQ